ncbi:hypothetical protein, partial [Escherichia coli]
MNLISNMPASLFIPSVHISGIVLRVAGQIVASPPGEQFRRPDTTPQRKRLVRTVLIFTESSDQLSRATDRV